MTSLTPRLRSALLADAIVSSLASAGMIAGATLLAEPLGLPAELLTWAGVACLPFIGLIAFALTGRAGSSLIAAIIAINFLWVAASLYVSFGPSFSPTLLGRGFVLVQGAMVFVFAELQMMALRRGATN